MERLKNLNGKKKLIIFGVAALIFVVALILATANVSTYSGGITGLFETKTDTVDFVITIVDSLDPTKPIANARFVIQEMTISNDAYVFSPPYDADGNVLGSEEVIDGETVYVFESDENGQIITQLRNGIYKLEQISTIDGYDSLQNAIHFYFGVGEGLGALVELDANDPLETGHTNNVTEISEYCVEGRADGSALYYNIGYLTYIEYIDGEDVVVWEESSSTVKAILSDADGFDVLTDTSILRYDDEDSGTYSTLTSALSGASKMVKNSDGDFVVAGTYSGTLTISAANMESGTSTSITSSKSTSDIYIAVVDSETGLVKEIYGIPLTTAETMSDMDIMQDGNYVISYFPGGTTASIMIIDAESQSLSNSVTVPTTRSNNKLVNDVAVGPETGNIFYGGSFSGTVSFTASQTASGEAMSFGAYDKEDGIVIIYDENLLVVNAIVIGGDGDDHFYKTDLTADGGLLFAGDSDTGAFNINGSLTQSGISISTTPQWDNVGTWRGIAFKVNEEGEAVWGKEFGYTSDEGMYAVTAFTNNSFALCGLETGSIKQSVFIRVNEDVLMEEILAVESLTLENVPITYEVTTEVSGGNGSVTGCTEDVCEIVAWGCDSKEDITVTADLGYKIKKITIQEIDDDGNTTIVDEITFTDTTTEYTLDKFTNVKTDINIIAEFEERAATVEVNYYLEGTTTKVLSNDGTEVGPDEFIGLAGYTYTITPNTSIASYYELVETPSNATGTYTDSMIQVTFYYKLKEYNYTVEHYYDGVLDSTKTDTSSAVYGTQIDTYTLKNQTGYVFSSVQTIPLTIGEDESKNVIKVYYDIDETQTKEVTYTVKYYKEGTLVSADTQTVTDTVQVLEDDVITVNKSDINILDKYYGYKLDKITYGTVTNASVLPDEVDSGTTINVYYVIDDSKQETISYTVEYYKDNVKVDSDTQTVTATIQVLEEKVLTVDKTTINVTDKYEGYAFDKTEPSTIPSTISDGEVIKVYYIARTDLSYTVNYYIKDTTTKVAESKTVTNQTFGETVTETAKDIEGYNRVNTEESIEIAVSGNEINFYYTARTDLSYTVNYYIKDTTTKVADSKTVTNQTFGETVTETAKDIEGYNKVNTEESIEIKVSGNEIVFYYTARTDLSYTVNYYIKDTTTKVADSKTVTNQTFGETVTEIAKDIEGYNKVNTEESIEIKVSGNEIVFYYTARTDLEYTVNYYLDGTEISVTNSKTETNQIFGSTVKEFAVDVEGYNKVSPEEKSITIGIKDNVINFYYTKRNDLEYTVKYLEQDTDKELSSEKVVTGQIFGETVTETAIDIEGYNKVDTEESIEIKVSGNEIIFYYTARTDLSYTVKYLEQDTDKELSSEKVVTGQTFKETVTETAIDIEGYNKVNTSENIEIAVSGNEIIFYYTKVSGLSYTVNYYLEGTTEEVSGSKVVDGMVFEDSVTEEAIDIEGYNKVSPTEETIVIGVGDNIINFYYTKRTDLSYTVKYLEQDTDKELSSEKVVTGQTFKETVTETAIDIEGYNKVNTSENIEIAVSGNEIIFYYTKVSGLSYTVNYYLEGTTEEVSGSKVVDGMVFEDSVTEEAIDIEGYNKVSPTEETIVIGVGDNIINFYYTKRTDLSYTVQYLEQYTNKELSSEKIVTGQTFKDTVTETAIDIEGYNKVNTSEIIEIAVSGNEIVFYYTARTDLSYTVQYLEKDTNKELNTEKVVTNQTYNTSVIETAIDIRGYNNVNTSESITIDVDNNLIIFYYTIKTDLEYTVNYLEQGTEDVISESKTVKDQTYNTSITEDAIDIVGYNNVNTSETITIDVTNNVINFYYTKRTDIKYTVEYYYNDELKETEENVATFKQEITTYTDKVLTGYKLKETVNLPLTISATEEDNVIKVYYVTDDGQTKDLSYTVEYYLDNTIVTADTHGKQITVQYLEDDTITVDKDTININDKYYGYKLDRIDVNTTTVDSIPDTVNNNDVIRVYYTVDDSQVMTLSYTVEYYKDGEKVDADTETVTEVVQVLEEKYLTVKVDEINTVSKYTGYKLDTLDPETIPTRIATDSVIKVYYVRDTFGYTVEYYYDGLINADETEQYTATYNDEITTYEDKNITGYKLEKEVNLPLTISHLEQDNVIKIYYVKDEFDYTIEYYYDGVLKETVTKTETYGNKVESYEDKAGYGYEYSEHKNIPLTITENPDNNVIKVYYVRKDATVRVKYEDGINGGEISEDTVLNGKVFDSFDVSTEVKDIPGYTLIESPSEMTGTFEEEEQVRTYKYALTTSVVVKYLENDTNVELLPEETIVGYETKSYSTTQKTVTNYTFVKDTGNTSGNMTKNTITVIYYYAQNTKVTVNHIDINTGDILAQDVQNGKVGDEYESHAKSIDNYVLVREPSQATVTMIKDEIIIEYYYAHLSDGVAVEYIDVKTNDVLDTVYYSGNEGDAYTTSSKVINGYDLVESMLPDNAEGNMTIEGIKVKYYYIRKTAVSVKYIDVITNQEIPEGIDDNGMEISSYEYIEGHEGDSYTTVQKTFDGYDLYEYPNNANSTMEVSIDENGDVSVITNVTYYYIYRTKVIENHIDVVTGDIIETVEYTGYETDNYLTSSKEYEIFDLVEEKMPNNESGNMTKEDIIVNYYYIQKTKVIVNYIDLATKEILTEVDRTTKMEVESTVLIEGHEGDTYDTYAKVFDGYDLVENMLPENKSGNMTKGDITVNYYYLYRTSIKVLYIEKETGNNITDATVIDGHEGDKYTITPKEVTKYKLIESPENESGVMTKQSRTFVYYYIRVSDGVKEQHIDIATGNVIKEVIHEGNVGDSYSIDPSAVDGYDLIWEKLPTNNKGTMEDGVIEVKFYHSKKADSSGGAGGANGSAGGIGTPATGDIVSNTIITVICLIMIINVVSIIIKKRKIKK